MAFFGLVAVTVVMEPYKLCPFSSSWKDSHSFEIALRLAQSLALIHDAVVFQPNARKEIRFDLGSDL